MSRRRFRAPSLIGSGLRNHAKNWVRAHWPRQHVVPKWGRKYQKYRHKLRQRVREKMARDYVRGVIAIYQGKDPWPKKTPAIPTPTPAISSAQPSP